MHSSGCYVLQMPKAAIVPSLPVASRLPVGDIALPIDSSFLTTHPFVGGRPKTGFVGFPAFLPVLCQSEI